MQPLISLRQLWAATDAPFMQGVGFFVGLEALRSGVLARLWCKAVRVGDAPLGIQWSQSDGRDCCLREGAA